MTKLKKPAAATAAEEQAKQEERRRKLHARLDAELSKCKRWWGKLKRAFHTVEQCDERLDRLIAALNRLEAES